jgi:flagellin-like hook-associated protein FlgL
MFSGISLSSGIRASLFNLNQTNFLLQKSQNRLATGLKVNTPLDNAASFFQASNLNQRALDLTRLLDNTTKATGVLTTAQAGLASINSLLEQARGYAQDALAATTSGNTGPASLTPGAVTRANTYTTSEQISDGNGIVGLSDGTTVSVWSSEGQDGFGFEVYAQRFAADGTKIGSEFRINQTVTSNQLQASITEVSAGGFLVTWNDESAGAGLMGRRYDASGVAQTGEFKINATSGNTIQNSDITQLSDGNFVATYSINGQDGSDFGIYARKFNASGTALGAEFRVNTFTSNEQRNPSVAALNNGGFVVTWDSAGQDGSGFGVYGQRYDGTGSAAGSEFLVNQVTSGYQYQSAVTTLNNGDFVVTWANDDDFSVRAKRFNSSGVAIGSEVTVKTGTSYLSKAHYPTIQSINDGGFVVAYATSDAVGVYAQRYDANMNTVGSEILIGNTTVNNSYIPSLGKLSNGGFVVGYDSDDGSFRGVYHRRYDLNTSSSGDPNLPVRANYANLFNDIIDEINSIAEDSGYDGVNLLKNQNFKVNFNEKNTNSLELQGGLYDGTGLGLLSSLTSGAWATDTEINMSLSVLDNAISVVDLGISKYTSKQSIIDIQQNFMSDIITTLQDGAEKLTVLDTNRETANLLALQARQQLGLTALSLTAQGEQNAVNFLQSLAFLGSNKI